MSKEKMTAEQIKKVQDHMKTILKMSSNDREVFIAQTIGDVYDIELPIPEVISAISDIGRAGNRPEDNHVYYLMPEGINKEVFTLDSNCNVIQKKVTPNSRQELDINELVSNDYWICLSDFLSGDHNALQFAADSIDEALNRKEIRSVLDLLSAGAASTGNEFTLDTGKDALDYPKVVEMVRSVAKYGRNLVLITGSDVTTDVMLMDFTANTFRPYGLDNLNIKHIPIEELKVDTDASGQVAVLAANVAYLVAVSDAKQNKPLFFARRKLAPLADMSDSQVLEAKERVIIDTGNMKNVAGVNKYARGKAGYEQFGAVLINKYVVAKFTRTA